jgi:hypothetical protein
MRPRPQLDLTTLTPEQLVRRSGLINTLAHYYLTTTCCRRTPDWHEKLYRMSLEALEQRYVEVFKRPYTGD